MKTTQYTIRNVPAPVDQYLRKKSRLTGKSLNQVIIDELSDKASYPSGTIGHSLDWFIGSNSLDEATLQALAEDDAAQKGIAEKEMKKLDDLGY